MVKLGKYNIHDDPSRIPYPLSIMFISSKVWVMEEHYLGHQDPRLVQNARL